MTNIKQTNALTVLETLTFIDKTVVGKLDLRRGFWLWEDNLVCWLLNGDVAHLSRDVFGRWHFESYPKYLFAHVTKGIHGLVYMNGSNRFHRPDSLLATMFHHVQN